MADAGYMCAAIGTTSLVLIQSNRREAHLRRELEQRANTDSLTGLATRRVFDSSLDQAVAAGDRGGGASLILLDIDLFKTINDRHGHPGGDQVLVQISELLQDSARAGDVICRLGGDELGLLMPGCTVENARRRADQIVDAVRHHGFIVDSRAVIEVSVSVGLAHTPTHAGSPAGLYQAADQALYNAKHRGRDQVALPA
jgi:diguanylate cyclase (GGDEF)-like protein